MPVALASAGIAGGLSLLGQRQSSAQRQATAAQTDLARQQTGLMQQMREFAQRQYTTSEPALSAALRYYTTLTAGSPAEIGARLAPQYAQVGDIYRGAQRGLEMSTRGPQRDVALGELARSRAERLAMLPLEARMGAASELGHLGAQGVGQAGTFMGSAVGAGQAGLNAYQTLLQNEYLRRAGWQSLGQSLGEMFLPYIMQRYGQTGASPTGAASGSPAPSGPFGFPR